MTIAVSWSTSAAGWLPRPFPCSPPEPPTVLRSEGASRDLAGGKRTAADLGAWLIFEDESGQGLRPPKGRTWGRRGRTPVVKVTGAHHTRVSLAALIAIKPGYRPRLICRVHRGRGQGKDRRKGFTEAGYAGLLDAAHQQLGGPLVVVWDYVARHIIPVVCPAVLCGQRRLVSLVVSGWTLPRPAT